jgi:antitoxin component YwqK of YwqJK toxin-antitoxin module
MKQISSILLGCMFFTACQNTDSTDQVVSQTFVHKYGFETTEKEWEARDKDGQIVSTLKNGVKITRSYENGQLHGPTTRTFPKSAIIETTLVYDQGTLLKETVNDPSGMPIREEVYEFDNRMIVTLWDNKGVPLSVEEYDDELLVEAKYFTPDHELEATVELGFGERVKRDRTGVLVSRDEIAEGIVTARTTYHPNGQVHTISHYHDYQLHGEQLKFSATGRPLMELHWNHGVIDGPKIVYRNGIKVAEVPYINGQKHGTELHFDDLGNLTAEIQWRNDKKHGSTQLHSEESSETEWFFNGQTVSAERFKSLENREKTVAGFNSNEIR